MYPEAIEPPRGTTRKVGPATINLDQRLRIRKRGKEPRESRVERGAKRGRERERERERERREQARDRERSTRGEARAMLRRGTTGKGTRQEAEA